MPPKSAVLDAPVHAEIEAAPVVTEPAPMTKAEALASDKPEARLQVMRDAWERQNTKNPVRPPKHYSVSFRDKSLTVEARDEAEAWAKFCDAMKDWPSPKLPGRTIKEVPAPV